MNTVHNERIKLLAGAMNNLALAVIVAGFLAPAINGQLHAGYQALTTLAWIAGGCILHCFAQLVLGGLRA
jgi:hypothetical protein